MDELSPITPVNFFQLSFDCKYLASKGSFPVFDLKSAKEYILPDTSVLCHEEHFASVAMGWNEEWLEFCFQVEKPVEQVSYPEISKGDSVEIFIDTRDVKTSGFNTRFCHHFYFLPESVEGHQAGELTHFRTEDAHELCDPSELKVKAKESKGQYTLHCQIPRSCLFGYDPTQFDRMGFTYRVNRPRWQSQHLTVVSEDFQIEQQPSLWGRLRLIE